jgi:hypothetical protein
VYTNRNGEGVLPVAVFPYEEASVDFGGSSLEERHMVAQWLRHHAINREVAGLMPDEVIFF